MIAGVPRRALLTLGLLCASGTLAENPEGQEARFPAVILLYSRDGSNSLQGVCHDEERNTVCDLTELWIIPPDVKSANADEQGLLRQLQEEQAERSNRLNKEMAQASTRIPEMKAQLEDKAKFGPQGRRLFKEMLDAIESRDIKRFAHASTEEQRRTCHLRVVPLQLSFHRIGPRKWVTDANTEGLCQLVQVWELSVNDKDALRTTVPIYVNMAVTTVSVGVTAPPLCKWARAEQHHTDRWTSITAPKRYEPQPPCDFIAPTPF